MIVIRAPDELPSVGEIMVKKISGKQIRAARALLGWSQTDLATVSLLSQSPVARAENDAESIKESTLKLLAMNLEQAGIQFINEEDGTVGVVLVPKSEQEGSSKGK